MLLASRNIVPALGFTAGLKGDDATMRKLVEDGKKAYAGTELRGKTVGIIGLGAVGRQVADAAIALGMQVIGYDPNITVDAAWSLSCAGKEGVRYRGSARTQRFRYACMCRCWMRRAI